VRKVVRERESDKDRERERESEKYRYRERKIVRKIERVKKIERGER